MSWPQGSYTVSAIDAFLDVVKLGQLGLTDVALSRQGQIPQIAVGDALYYLFLGYGLSLGAFVIARLQLPSFRLSTNKREASGELQVCRAIQQSPSGSELPNINYLLT